MMKWFGGGRGEGGEYRLAFEKERKESEKEEGGRSSRECENARLMAEKGSRLSSLELCSAKKFTSSNPVVHN